MMKYIGPPFYTTGSKKKKWKLERIILLPTFLYHVFHECELSSSRLSHCIIVCRLILKVAETHNSVANRSWTEKV